MQSNLLINDKPVVINTKLAVVLGLSESIVLQQMNYWIEKSKHIIEGKRWIYNTYSSWQEQLPFFCESTIRRIIKKLESMEVVLSGNFNKSKMDKTKWYSINYDTLDKLQEKFNMKDIGENSSSNNDHMDENIDESNCSNLAVDATDLNKPIPEITTEEEEEIGARPLGENGKTAEAVKIEQNEDSSSQIIGNSEEDNPKDFNDILSFFNSNIHLTTPHECEKLKLLHEEIKNPDLILKAMELAVENRARSFRYIEVVLYNWVDLKLHTLQEVEDYINKNNDGGKGYSAVNASKEGNGNHGENKYSKWGSGQHSGNYKKAQSKEHGKYAGFKPECTEVPDFTDEELEDFI
ncbi:DnaD domain-containing protein [Clostridium peptidivorans]|uniref:DnaD domain-containing protein n=1 Tax=Clostridium peptidivorans TaxID=100174 RepID=UPI000BE233BF|nr:DnaD domain protein [Clostridium peptidivorans]